MSSTVKASFWSGTQFAIKTFPEQRALAEQRGWKVDGQEEKCETTGRLHIQFWVKTPHMRRSQVSKIFQGAHLEPAKNVAALKNYCQKEETRVGDMPEASHKYPTQDKLFALFASWLHGILTCNKRSHYPRDGEEWLRRFDQCCESLIVTGYRVESLAVNPAVRSAIKKFGDAIYHRHISEKFEEEAENHPVEDSQTDRQAELFSQSVVIPTIDASRREDTEEGSRTDSTSAGEDFQDDFSTASEGYDESPDDDDCEASGGTSYTE